MNAQRALLLVFALACRASWAGSPFAFDGRVHDVKTHLPLEGVFIIVQWQNTGGGLVDARTTCGNLFITQTDALGRYHVPSYLPAISPFVDRYVTAYKMGYVWARAKESMSSDEYERSVRDMAMRVYTGTGDERLRQFTYTGYLRNCGPDKLQSYMKLHPLERAIHDELKTLKVSPDQEEELAGQMDYLRRFEGELSALGGALK